jgi:hypothetical protein
MVYGQAIVVIDCVTVKTVIARRNDEAIPCTSRLSYASLNQRKVSALVRSIHYRPLTIDPGLFGGGFREVSGLYLGASRALLCYHHTVTTKDG